MVENLTKIFTSYHKSDRDFQKKKNPVNHEIAQMNTMLNIRNENNNNYVNHNNINPLQNIQKNQNNFSFINKDTKIKINFQSVDALVGVFNLYSAG